MSIDDTHIALARVRREKNGSMRLATSVIDVDPHTKTWSSRLTEPLDGIDPSKLLVRSVLPGDNYQLLLVEVPDVPADEVKSAVRWQIKDLLDHPVDDTLIEILDMPRSSASSQKSTAYAVTTPRSGIERHIAAIHNAGFSADVIDIPELCARNIAALLPQDADGVALLHFTEAHGILTITRQGVLYLTRRIEVGRTAILAAASEEFTRTELIEGIALEIQRSLDYYESHFDRRPLHELVLGPGSDIGGLAESLNRQLGLTVSSFDLNDLFTMQSAPSLEEQGACLLAIGAALRSESLAAQD